MWCTKYNPVNWTQFIGNAPAIAKCKQWVGSFPGSGRLSERVLLISGPDGCGKSAVAVMLLAGYKVYRFTLQNVRENLNDFGHLFASDLRPVNNGLRHAIVIDDFEGLSGASKVFHANLVELVTKGGTHSPPIILTVTTITAASEKRRRKSYEGLAKLATEVVFSGLKDSEVQGLIQRLAIYEGIVVGPNVCRLIAEYSHGDIRKAIMGFEMLGKGKMSTGVTDDAALDWVDKHSIEQDEKIVFDAAGAEGPGTGTAANLRKFGVASDEDRILHVALTSPDRKVARAAASLIQDNSKQFTPLLFQIYPGISSMSKAALIAEEFSLSDVIREGSWKAAPAAAAEGEGEDGDGDSGESLSATLSSFSVDFPLRRLKMLKGIENLPRIRTSGYEMYYGYRNVLRSQRTVMRSLGSSCPVMWVSGFDRSYLLTMQQSMAGWLGELSDEDIVKLCLSLSFHPDNIDLLARVKYIGAAADSVPSIAFTRARKKRIMGMWDAALEAQSEAVGVKFLELPLGKATPIDDPFCLSWS